MVLRMGMEHRVFWPEKWIRLWGTERKTDSRVSEETSFPKPN